MDIGASTAKESGTTSATEQVEKTGSKTDSFSGTTREGLEISDEAVDKIIADVLGAADGLSAIFAGEQTAGIFGSSVSAQAAGDLAANLAGEIAKLRAVKVTEEESSALSDFQELTFGEASGSSTGSTSGADFGFDLFG